MKSHFFFIWIGKQKRLMLRLLLKKKKKKKKEMIGEIYYRIFRGQVYLYHWATQHKQYRKKKMSTSEGQLRDTILY